MRLWLERKVINFTRKMNLRGKIFIMYVLILLVPTLILGSGSIYLVIRSLHQNYLVTVDESVRQTARNVDFGKRSYDLLAVRTATDGELIARLGRDYADTPEVVDTVNYVDRTFLITSKYLPGIVDLRIYHTNETLVQDGQLLWRPEARNISGIDERTWYNAIIQSPDALHWSIVPDDPSQVMITRKIIGPTGDVLGVVYILLSYDAVFGELLGHPFHDRGNLYILDQSRQIIAATKQWQIGGNLKADESKPRGHIIVKPLSSGWNVVAVFQMRSMDQQSWSVLMLISCITAFFLLLSVFLMLTIVKNIVWRIRRLGNRMNDLSRGEFEATVRHYGQDELGEVESMFNSMSTRLGKLVEDITKAGQMEKKQTFKALQAQINPHFIYNSLGLIRWRALDAKDDEQIRIIDALTTFYRLTLNSQISVIPLRDELEHVRAYLEIQQLRYPGRVLIEWEIGDDVLPLYTVKTILQPIVENCYLHGAITRKKDAVIRISVTKRGKMIEMSVFDNGRGISDTTLLEIEEGRIAEAVTDSGRSISRNAYVCILDWRHGSLSKVSMPNGHGLPLFSRLAQNM